MEYLPLFLQLKSAPVLVVGGGSVALRKAQLLVDVGARVTVVAPRIVPPLQALLEGAQGQWLQCPYQAQHLKLQHLVIAATADREVNKQVSMDAAAIPIPVNVVDDPQLCSFIFPAIVDRSPLLIAISSSGHSPVLTRLMRSKIEALIPAAYGRLAAFAGRFRAVVRAAVSDEGHRRRLWERLLDGPVAELVLAGREEQAATLLQSQLQQPQEKSHSGEVYLIGAGPGDPDLLSFKAARLLQRADVVLYDRLVSSEIVAMARRDAERIYVGKARAEHHMPQQQINQLLLTLAQQGKCVARLKGGDPFIFGRGGEEIELLAQNRIPFQVVPGVTAASGCACYAGIPLTHRDHAQSVRFLTGNLKNNTVDLPWQDMQNSSETLVFYMGLQGLPIICEQLQAHGRDRLTPIALVERGTTEQQRVIIGTLEDLCDKVAAQDVHAPTLIIVGGVVSLHQQLSWYHHPAG